MVEKQHSVWVRFGAEVRRLRTNAGFSQSQLSTSMRVSPALLSAIERGTRAPKRAYAESLDAALDTGGTLTRLWRNLNNQETYPDWFMQGVLLERQASEIREYQALVMPGLSQVESYTRSILRLGRPWDTPDEIDRLVGSRLKRAEILEGPSRPLLWAVVDEGTLRRVVGSPAIMREQLQQLLDLGDAQKLYIQVIPTQSRNHPGLSGPFRLMSFSDRLPIAYAEHAMGEVPLDDTEEVRWCNALFGALQAEAMSTSASVDLIRKVQGELQ